MNRFKAMLYGLQAWWLEGQIEACEVHAESCRLRAAECHKRLRRVRRLQALATPASTLLAQALSRRG